MPRALHILAIVACFAAPANGDVDVSGPPQQDSTNSDTMAPATPSPESTSSLPAQQADNPAIDTVPLTRRFIEASADSSWWYRKIDNRAFGVGERLEFSVKYGKLPAGKAVIEIPAIETIDGHPCYKAVSVANSNDVVSVFYKVRDSVQTFMDVPGVFPRKFWKRLREGGYHVDRTTVFDQRLHLAITGKDTVPTYAFAQDPLSSIYYLRTQELVPGQDVSIDSHADKKNYPLKVLVLRKETIKVPAGKFRCLVIEPVMRAEGIFKAKGRIWIWLTDDQYKMPVLMKTEVFFLGSVTAQLSKYARGEIEGALE